MKIEVGKFYIEQSGWEGGEAEVLFTGKEFIVFTQYGTDHSWCREAFENRFTEVKPKRETIELFWCVTNFGDMHLCDSGKRYPYFEEKGFHKATNITNRIIPNQKSLFIYADTFEFVEGE